MQDDYRLSVYFGRGEKAQLLKEKIAQQVAADVRFRGSPMNFVRYAVNFALSNDPSLQKPKAA